MLLMQGQLFGALRRTRLIPEGVGWEGLQYSRCGRTDKGVSALGQACIFFITLNLSYLIPRSTQQFLWRW